MTKQEIMESYGICGLVCALCSYNTHCAGCRRKSDNCDVKACCIEKGLNYCFECGDYPCDRKMHKGIRSRAFNTVARTEGLDRLAEYLHANLKRGITYHRADKLAGDYDRCGSAEEVIDLLKNGRPDPYLVCPTYESKSFIVRLVRTEDAGDLFLCYGDTAAQKIFNSDCCTSDFCYSSLDEMKKCVDSWLHAYDKKWFVRFGIIDKQNNKAVGTVEIFDRGEKELGHSVLRIDIISRYENEGNLSEILRIADRFFCDFRCSTIVTKAMPEATLRIRALEMNGYEPHPKSASWKREHYYIKRSP